jgi:hypothetical protein
MAQSCCTKAIVSGNLLLLLLLSLEGAGLAAALTTFGLNGRPRTSEEAPVSETAGDYLLNSAQGGEPDGPGKGCQAEPSSLGYELQVGETACGRSLDR